MLILRIRRGEPARPQNLCDDIRPTHDIPFSKNTLPNIPLSSSSHTPFGRAGTPLHGIHPVQWTSCRANDLTYRYDINIVTCSPSAPVGASLLARKTYATIDARHTTIHSQKIYHQSFHYLRSPHSGVQARPYIVFIRNKSFRVGQTIHISLKNNLKNSTSGPTLLSSTQNKKSGVMPDLFAYFFPFFFHSSCNHFNFSGFSRMYRLTLNNSSSFRNTRS